MSKKPNLAVGIPDYGRVVERLKQAVESAGGQAAVSKASGIPPSSLNEYLGGSEARFTRMAAIAAACNVSLDWLVGKPIEAPGRTVATLPILAPDILDAPAHFWALYVLIRSAQEFYSKTDLVPSLADILQFIGPSYIVAVERQLPDLNIEFNNSEDINI